MKKIFYIAIAFIVLLSCNKAEKAKMIEVVTISATADNIWHYYCGGARKVVGTGVEADNAKWADKTNWDIAFQKHRIKINGGTSSAKNSGGLAIYDGTMLFEEISGLTSTLDFKVDREAIEMINGVETNVSRSEYQVVNFIGDTEEYTKAPVYILRGDTAEKYYKIDFTNYMVNGEPGNIEFKIAQIGI